MNKLTNLLAGLLVSGAVLVPALLATAAGNNLIANPSVETANGSVPASFANAKTGTNTTTFNYLNTGHTGSRSLQVQMTKHTGGQAEWYFTPVAVTANTKYTFSDWYQSNVQTHYHVMVTKSGGSTVDFADSNLAASTSWKQGTISFTTPKNAVSVTVYHYLNSVGQLTTDDFDLEGPTVTAPTVSVSAPAATSTVSGTQTVTAATTAGTYTIKNVQFQLDGVNLGAADTTAPYSVSWNTLNSINGGHNLTAVLTTTSGLTITSTPVNVTVNNIVTLPTATITAPVPNATVSGTQTVAATATAGSYAIKNVQFQLDGVNLGTADTTAPYSVSWNTKSNTFGAHNLTAIVNTTTTGVSATSTTVPVNVNNATAPTVSITAPAPAATVKGTQAVTANAADAQGTVSVQFKLNGNNLGNPVTAAPYTYNWDTTTVADGNYSLTAVATDSVNLTTTSTPVAVTVQNTAVVTPPNNGPNLILNPSLETSASGTTPDSWLSSNWGTNTTAFSYLNTGHTGSHSVKVQTTAYTNGAANWYYADLPVTAGTTYQYSNWYQSNVATEVDAEVTMTDGTVSYYYLGSVAANTNWTQFKTTFVAPAGAKSMAIYQILAKVGYITSDDYSLNTYTPEQFNRGIVTINFDDGWLDQYTNGLPALQANGNLPATFFIITDSSITNPDPEYMNVSQIINLKNDGEEIGNHTETHPDLTTLTAAQVQTEMGGAEAALQSAIGVTATDFAYPFGAYNPSTIAIGQQVGFVSQRSVNSGFNTKDSIDFTQLKIEEVDADITPAQVQAWVDQANAQKTWLILVYHEIDTVAPAGSDDTAYMTSPTNLNTELAYIHSTGMAVETTAQAINEIQPQLQ